MIPKLYESNEKKFESNGIGVLVDALSCIVTEELNGAYELELQYPINGYFTNEFALRRIVFAKPNPFDNPQPFRIYSIRRELTRLVIYAEHISYDLNGYAVQMEQSGDIYEYINYIKSNTVNDAFDFEISLIGTAPPVTFFEYLRPGTARALLFDLTKQPGEYVPDLKFDCFKIDLLTEGRGSDNGFKIVYGVNLLDYSQNDIFQDVYTHIMPYWVNHIGTGQEFLVTNYLPEKIVSTGINYDFQRILPVDFTSAMSGYEDATVSNFRFEIETYLSNNNLGIPDPEIYIDFISESTKEYEKIELGDVVHLIIPGYNLDIPKRCTKTVYDCLKRRYKGLEIGRTKTGIETDIYNLFKQTQENKLDIAYERIYSRKSK